MRQKQTFSEKVLQFDQKLSNVKIDLPDSYKIINPYNGRNKKPFKTVLNESVSERFYFGIVLLKIKKVYA